jgi:ankyrin repeat protein
VEAVKLSNKERVELLLGGEANPNHYGYRRTTPLEAAVANADKDMVRLLFSRGADPADKGAFDSAIENNQRVVTLYLKYSPRGILKGSRGFGGDLVTEAIE